MDEQLTHKQRVYAANIVRGMESFPAAKNAGYSNSYARVIGHRLKEHPAVQQAIQTAHAELREQAKYDVEQSVVEIDRAVKFGYEKGNPMSVAKLLELKAKLYGLLIDRYQEVPVDLKAALAEARGRVLTMINPMPSHGQASLLASQVLTAPQPTGPGPDVRLSADGAKAWKPFSGD